MVIIFIGFPGEDTHEDTDVSSSQSITSLSELGREHGVSDCLACYNVEGDESCESLSTFDIMKSL